MLNIVIAIPLRGDVGSVEIRPTPPNGEYLTGPPSPILCGISDVDAAEFMAASPHDLAVRFAEPMLAALQNGLRARGF